MMKKFFLSALALIGLGTMASAQFYVVGADGSVLYKMDEGVPAYVTFENPLYKGTVGQMVDLGLTSGTKWADHNIGASSPEEYGDYYAWGETTTKETYVWTTYKLCKRTSDSMTKYCTSTDYGTVDDKTELEDADDVAVQTWGGKWKMPTRKQQDELRDECYWVWTTSYNGQNVNGFIVYKAKSASDKGVKVYSGSTPSSSYNVITDAHIFLPTAGYRDYVNLYRADSNGYYWSRSLRSGRSGYASFLNFDSGSVGWSYYYRYYGQSVRPVCPATE